MLAWHVKVSNTKKLYLCLFSSVANPYSREVYSFSFGTRQQQIRFQTHSDSSVEHVQVHHHYNCGSKLELPGLLTSLSQLQHLLWWLCLLESECLRIYPRKSFYPRGPVQNLGIIWYIMRSSLDPFGFNSAAKKGKETKGCMAPKTFDHHVPCMNWKWKWSATKHVSLVGPEVGGLVLAPCGMFVRSHQCPFLKWTLFI